MQHNVMKAFGGNVEASANERGVLLLLLVGVCALFAAGHSAWWLGGLYRGCESCWFL